VGCCDAGRGARQQVADSGGSNFEKQTAQRGCTWPADQPSRH
jgi:hypothetical protein